MPKARRLAGYALAAVAFWAVSCREIPAPDNGIQSISALILGSPGLVAGDTLRDSLGLAVPLQIIAYGVDNQPVDPQPVPAFIVLDTGAILAQARYLVGVTPGTTVRVVGEVGFLQTQPETVKVTLSPDALVASDSTTHHVRYTGFDSLSQVLNTRVLHYSAGDTSGVEAVIVHYDVVAMPPAVGAIPTAVLLNGNTVSDRDTTDNTGRSSRTLRLRPVQIARERLVEDTVIVNADASYRGASIGTIQFLLIFTNAAPPPAGAAGIGKP
jgi:hypothetical protein